MGQDHRIDTCKLLFTNKHSVDNEDVHGLLASVKNDLVVLLNTIFDRYFVSDAVIEIEQIKLDIGSIPISNFKETYLNRIETLLVSQIEALVEKRNFQTYVYEKQNATKLDSFQLLASYLKNGYSIDLQKNSNFNFNTYFLSLLESDKEKVLFIVRGNLSNPYVVHRLKYLHPDILKLLAHILVDKPIYSDHVSVKSEAFTFLQNKFSNNFIQSSLFNFNVFEVDALLKRLYVNDATGLLNFIVANYANTKLIFVFSKLFELSELVQLFNTSSYYYSILKKWKKIQEFLLLSGFGDLNAQAYRLLFIQIVVQYQHNKSIVADLVCQFILTHTHLHTKTNLKVGIDIPQELDQSFSDISDIIHKILFLVDKKQKKHIAERIDSDDLSDLIYYLRFGISRLNHTVTHTLQLLLQQHVVRLMDAILKYWNEEGVRFRLAYQFDISILEQLVDAIWSNHYSYRWWSAIEQRLIFYTDNFNSYTTSVIQDVYFAYFNFLYYYEQTILLEDQFEDLLIHSVNKGTDFLNISNTSVLYERVFPRLISSTAIFMNELDINNSDNNLKIINWLKQSSDADIQLFLENIIDKNIDVSLLFKSDNFTNTIRDRIYSISSANQLGQLLYRLVSMDMYRFIISLYEETSSILLKSNFSVSSQKGVIPKQWYIEVLNLLRFTIGEMSIIFFAHKLVHQFKIKLNIDLQELYNTSVCSNIELMRTYPHASIIFRNNRIDVNRTDINTRISKSSFLSVLAIEYPSIAGFIHTYILAIEYYLFGVSYTTQRLLDSYLHLIYSWLNKQESKISIRTFLYEINREIEYRYQLPKGDFTKGILMISDEQISKGEGRFYPLRESLLSTLSVDSNLNGISSDILNTDQLITLRHLTNENKIGIWSDDFSAAFTEYIHFGLCVNLESNIYRLFTLEQFMDCITDVYIDNEKELYEFIKQFFLKSLHVDLLLNRNIPLLEKQVVNVLSGSMYSEFVSCNDELLLFFSNTNLSKSTSESDIIIRLRQYMLDYLCRADQGVCSLTSYILFVFNSIQADTIILRNNFDAVSTYFEVNKPLNLYSNIIKSIVNRSPSILQSSIDTKISRKSTIVVDQQFDKTLNDLFILVNNNAQQDVQLFFEYYLEKGNVLVDFLIDKNIDKNFFLNVTLLLNDSIRNRFLVVLAPSLVSYFSSIRNELKHFAVLYQFSFEFERALIAFYSITYYNIYRFGKKLSKEILHESFIESFVRVEENVLFLKFCSLIQDSKEYLSIDFPTIYSILIQASLVDRSTYIKAMHDKPNEEIRSAIQKSFPSEYEYVQHYIEVIELFYLRNTRYLSYYDPQDLFKRVYQYLHTNAGTFSVSGLIVMLNKSVLSSKLFSEIYFIQFITHVFKEKILAGNHYLKEIQIVFSQLYSHIPEKESVFANELVIHLHQSADYEASKSEFERLITYYYKDLAGFVFTFLKMLTRIQSFHFETSTDIQRVIYLKVYSILRLNTDSFSAQSFVKEMIQFISITYSIDNKKLIDDIFLVVNTRLETGESRYYVLNELIKPYREIPSESSDGIISVDEQRLTNDIHVSEMFTDDMAKMHIEQFKRILFHYMLHETILLIDGISLSTIDTFNNYIQEAFIKHEKSIYPLMKDFLLKENQLDIFLHMKDKFIFHLVLKHIAGNRIEEFKIWQDQLKNFVQWLFPSSTSDVVMSSMDKTLFQLLFNKDRITVGLFSFLELAIVNLRQCSIQLLTDDFRTKLALYKSVDIGDDLFIKALERINMVFAKQNRGKDLEELLKDTVTAKVEKITLEGRLQIQYAGVILIAPFLNRYFSMLDMLDDGQFKNQEIAARAVQLIHYLVVGKIEMEEHDLVLNKVLCGVPINYPIAHSFEISAIEIEISESLLKGVLANWDKMNGSSIDALRETFLVRAGYLVETKTHWELEVERRSLDILIDFIPWSFKLIKLPWMDMSIKTQWGKADED